MKTIPLEEAYQEATKGPLYATGHHVQSASLDVDNYVCEAEGNYDEQCKMNAALIVHCWNHFTEVVEALKDTVDRLEAWWEAAGCPPHETEIHIAEVRTFLTKATNIELPD